MKRQSSHVRTKRNLVWRGIEKFRANFSGILNGCISLSACRVGPMSVRVVVVEIVAHLFHHGARYLCPARSVEIGDWVAVVNSLESWKLLPDLGDCGNSCL